MAVVISHLCVSYCTCSYNILRSTSVILYRIVVYPTNLHPLNSVKRPCATVAAADQSSAAAWLRGGVACRSMNETDDGRTEAQSEQVNPRSRRCGHPSLSSTPLVYHSCLPYSGLSVAVVSRSYIPQWPLLVVSLVSFIEDNKSTYAVVQQLCNRALTRAGQGRMLSGCRSLSDPRAARLQ